MKDSTKNFFLKEVIFKVSNECEILTLDNPRYKKGSCRIENAGILKVCA